MSELVESTVSIAHISSLFSRFTAMVAAQRHLILLGPDERGGYLVAQARGVNPQRAFNEESICLSAVERSRTSRQAFRSESLEDLYDFESNEFLRYQVVAVLCVPLLGQEQQVVGFLYADDLRNPKAFSYTDLLNAQNLAKSLGTAPAPAPPSKSRSTPPVRPVAPTRPKTALSGRDLEQLFLNLATFVKAGIPLLQGMDALGQHSESPRLAHLCQEVASRLQQGHPLSSSLGHLARLPAAIEGTLLSAERSGQLAESLELLARGLERQRTRQLRLSSTLVYPCSLLLFSLLIVMLLPTYLLKGQLEFYQAQKMQLPGLSLALLRVGQLVGWPGTWLGLAAVGTASWAWLRHPTVGKNLKNRLQRMLHVLPVAGRLQRSYWECQLLTSLAMSLRSGVTLLEAIPLGIRSTGSALWEAQEENVLVALCNGKTLAQALRDSGLLGSMTVSLLVGGEESGRLVASLEWLVDFLEQDFEHAIDGFSQLLEPLVLALLGVLVGIITLASMLPSIQYMQSL